MSPQKNSANESRPPYSQLRAGPEGPWYSPNHPPPSFASSALPPYGSQMQYTHNSWPTHLYPMSQGFEPLHPSQAPPPSQHHHPSHPSAFNPQPPHGKRTRDEALDDGADSESGPAKRAHIQEKPHAMAARPRPKMRGGKNKGRQTGGGDVANTSRGGPYKREELVYLVECVNRTEPVGPQGWMDLASDYNKHGELQAERWPPRTYASLRDRYDKIVRTEKPTGDREVSPYIALAWAAAERIEEKSGAGFLDDNEEGAVGCDAKFSAWLPKPRAPQPPAPRRPPTQDNDCIIIIDDSDSDIDDSDRKPFAKSENSHKAQPKPAAQSLSSNSKARGAAPRVSASSSVVKGYRAPASAPTTSSSAKTYTARLLQQVSESLGPTQDTVRGFLSTQNSLLSHLQAEIRTRDARIAQLHDRYIEASRRADRAETQVGFLRMLVPPQHQLSDEARSYLQNPQPAPSASPSHTEHRSPAPAPTAVAGPGPSTLAHRQRAAEVLKAKSRYSPDWDGLDRESSPLDLPEYSI